MSNTKLELIKTQREKFNLDLRYSDGSPFSLDNVTDIRVKFPAESEDECIHINLSAGEIDILSSCAGKILVRVSGQKMALVREGDEMDWEILIFKNDDPEEDDPIVVQFRESLTVRGRVFPNC